MIRHYRDMKTLVWLRTCILLVRLQELVVGRIGVVVVCYGLGADAANWGHAEISLDRTSSNRSSPEALLVASVCVVAFLLVQFRRAGAFSLNVSVTATTSIGEGFEILRVTVGCFLLPNC
jgi:hypothetical protein